MKGNVSDAWTGHILAVDSAKDLGVYYKINRHSYLDALNTTNLSRRKKDELSSAVNIFG